MKQQHFVTQNCNIRISNSPCLFVDMFLNILYSRVCFNATDFVNANCQIKILYFMENILEGIRSFHLEHVVLR